MTILTPPAERPWHPLCDRLGLPRDIAYDPHWSAAADFLELIAGHALAARPAAIVECSSGATTVVLARCCALAGQGHVWSLENGAGFAARSRAELARLGLADYATVLDAPLVGHALDGRDFQWYDLTGLAVAEIDMLVIDGPPGFIQPLSRHPALPLLYGRLAADAAAFLDDAARPDERAIVEAWCRAYPSLTARFIANERGCAILGRAEGDAAEAFPSVIEAARPRSP